MSAIDILILLVAAVAVIFGLRKGLISQIGAVAGIIVGILACRLFGDWLTGRFIGENPGTTDLYVYGVISNVILFIVGYVGTRILARVIKLVSKSMKLSPLDRAAGVVFSLFEWMLVLSLLLNVWQTIKPEIELASRSKIAGGRVALAVMDLAPKVLGSETASKMWDMINNAGSPSDKNVEESQPQAD